MRLEIGYEGNFSFGGQAVFLATGNGTSIPVVDALCLDDTPEAYWEAFILWFTARQFYLYWHANYGTEAIVYDLRYFLGTYRDGDRTGGMVFDQLTAAEQRQLMGMKLTPDVKRNPEGGCDVLCTQFSPFSGFQRLQHSIVKKDVGIAVKFPSKCLESIYYDCGAMY